MTMTNRKAYIKEMKEHAITVLNSKLDDMLDGQQVEFLEDKIGREYIDYKIFDISNPWSKSTLSSIKLADYIKLVDGDCSVKTVSTASIPELVIELRSNPDTEMDCFRVVGAINKEVVDSAIEAGLTELPVILSCNGHQSLHGAGIWSLMSEKDIPVFLTSYTGNSSIDMPVPGITVENGKIAEVDAQKIAEAMDSFVSAMTFSPKKYDTETAQKAWKWAIQKEENGDNIAVLGGDEIFDMAVKFGVFTVAVKRDMDVFA